MYDFYLFIGGRIKALVDGLQYAGIALAEEDMKVGSVTVPSKSSLENRIDIIKKDIILRYCSFMITNIHYLKLLYCFYALRIMF